MSDAATRWPRLREYQAAIINAETTGFKDKRLRGLRVERHPATPGVAWPRHGAFGAVFKVKGNSAQYAVKVFYKPQLDRQKRYQLIDTYLKSIRMPRKLVSFAYDDKGITVNGEEYPTLVMDWADGIALDTYLDQRLASGKGVDNRRECKEWVATLRELQGVAIAHGDLQHKNILVQPGGRFRLVDYDGMFVPGMEQLAACEAGVSAYQHPQRARTEGHFHKRMDDFSALVILLTLACVDAELWKLYNKIGRLLVSEEDLQAPSDSPLLRQLSGRPGPVGALAGIVKEAAEGTLDEVPSFVSVISEVGTEWAAGRRGASASRIAEPARRGTGAGSIRSADDGRPATREASPGRSSVAPIQPPRPAGAAGISRPAALAGEGDLSGRQRQVAQLLAAGSSVGSIASALGLRPVTVASYVAALEQMASEQGAESLQAFVARYASKAERRPPVPPRALTPRQQEVLALLREGMLPGQIAGRLRVQPATLSRHLALIRAGIGGDELDALLAQAQAKSGARRAAAEAVKKAPATKTVGKQPVTRRPAKPVAGQTAPTSADARSLRAPAPAQPAQRIPDAPETNRATPKSGLSLPAIPSGPQPARPLSARPAAPSPAHRRTSSPRRSGAGTTAALVMVALTLLMVFLALAIAGALH